MQKKIEEIFFELQIIAFELVAVNTRFYWERILFIGCQYVKKKVKASDTAKTQFFELIFFESDQTYRTKILLCIFSVPLTC